MPRIASELPRVFKNQQLIIAVLMAVGLIAAFASFASSPSNRQTGLVTIKTQVEAKQGKKTVKQPLGHVIVKADCGDSGRPVQDLVTAQNGETTTARLGNGTKCVITVPRTDGFKEPEKQRVTIKANKNHSVTLTMKPNAAKKDTAQLAAKEEPKKKQDDKNKNQKNNGQNQNKNNQKNETKKPQDPINRGKGRLKVATWIDRQDGGTTKDVRIDAQVKLFSQPGTECVFESAGQKIKHEAGNGMLTSYLRTTADRRDEAECTGGAVYVLGQATVYPKDLATNQGTNVQLASTHYSGGIQLRKDAVTDVDFIIPQSTLKQFNPYGTLGTPPTAPSFTPSFQPSYEPSFQPSYKPKYLPAREQQSRRR